MLYRILARRASLLLKDPIDIKFKHMKKISEIYEFIENSDKTPSIYGLAARTLGIILNANQKDYDEILSIKATKFFTEIEEFKHEYSIEELSYIAFLLRTQRQFNFAKIFSSDFENFIAQNLNMQVNLTLDKETIINIYHNLGFLGRVAQNLERNIHSLIRNEQQFFTNEEFIKLLQGAYFSKRPSAKMIILEVLRLIENNDLQVVSSRYLAQYLILLHDIDFRYNIGSKILNIILDILLSRGKYLSSFEVDIIIEFYSLTDDYSRALFYESLHTLEKRLSNEEITKNIVLNLISSLGKIAKSGKNIKIDKYLIESLTHKLSEKVDNEKVGYLEFSEALINLGAFYNTIPESIENIVKDRAADGVPGLWTFKIIRGILNISNYNIDKFFDKKKELINNIALSSIKIKLEMIKNIINTKNYQNHPKLVEMLKIAKTECLKKTNGWKNAKYFLWAYESLKNDIQKEDFSELLYQALIQLEKNIASNSMWFNIKALVVLYSTNPNVYKLWKEIVLSIKDRMDENDLQRALNDIYDTEDIEAMLELSIILNKSNPNSTAHILSLNVKNAPDYLIDKAIKLVNISTENFVLNFCFNIRKRSLFTQIFTSGKGEQIQIFIDKLALLINSASNAKKITPLIQILGEYNFLNDKIAMAFVKLINTNDSEQKLHTKIMAFSYIPGALQKETALLNELISLDTNYSFNALREKINTYLSLPFTHDNEKEFLEQIEIKLNNIEKRDVGNLLDMISAINVNSEHHDNFILKLLQMASELVTNNIEYWIPSVLTKALIVFVDKFPEDENLIKKLESRIFNFDLVTINQAKIMTLYMKIGRNNNFLDNLCDKFQPRLGFHYAEELVKTYDTYQPENKKLEKIIKELRELFLSN